jgi:hypothetical protein
MLPKKPKLATTTAGRPTTSVGSSGMLQGDFQNHQIILSFFIREKEPRWRSWSDLVVVKFLLWLKNVQKQFEFF